MGRVPDEAAPAPAPFGKQVDREGVGPDLEVVEAAGLLNHRPHHLSAGGITEGMDDPVMAVAPLAAEFQAAIPLIKPRAPGDQFGDPLGCLVNDRLDHVLVAEPSPGGQRVGHVIVEAILGVDDACDPALSPLARRTPQIVLGDHRHRKPRVDRERRPQAGQPAA